VLVGTGGAGAAATCATGTAAARGTGGAIAGAGGATAGAGTTAGVGGAASGVGCASGGGHWTGGGHIGVVGSGLSDTGGCSSGRRVVSSSKSSPQRPQNLK
jgi:hypothetical protein